MVAREGRWQFVRVTCEGERGPQRFRPSAVAGVEAGVRHWVLRSTGGPVADL
ncbi:MAG: hypothetical protein K6U14_03805 [Firmicutes bacterium]|nr:hypothetical protein [Alicyclobacillaceae bacterium]MCL6496746.1 hypothetical protein [Bacillota bacterium]